MKRLLVLTIVTILAISLTIPVLCKEYHLKSPNQKLHLKIQVSDQIYCSIFFKSKQIFSPSPISMTLKEHGILGQKPKVKSLKRDKSKQVFEPVIKLKTKKVESKYRELKINFSANYALVFRAYNEGVAYRFITSFPQEITILKEQANFRFAKDFKVYFPEEKGFFSHNERYYNYLPVSTISAQQMGSLPTLIEVYNQAKVLITESDLRDYPGMWLKGTGQKTLTAIFPAYPQTVKMNRDRDETISKRTNYLAKTMGTRSFPWRIFIVAEKDHDLITNQLTSLLSAPNQLKDVSWIKPGKVAWDWWNANNIYGVNFKAGINTATYKYYIDFAARFGIEYIIMDEGWYKLGDLLAVKPQINMEEIMAYARQKGVGVILWVIWKTLDEQLHQALDQFERWGVKGIKVDFMQRDDQWMVNYYYKIAQEAAKRKMIVDFHGSYKPAGLHCAYPNVLTREGVRGLEQSKWTDLQTPEHNLTIPFIRMVTGPMDYTPGAMINAQEKNFRPIFNRPMSMGTRCHQVAMYVIYESPLQMMCDSPSNYLKEPECTEFIARIPTVWDDTVVLEAKIADYLIIARKNGEKWYLGAMSDGESREFKVSLDFLEKKNTYTADIVQDGPNANRFGNDYLKIMKEVKRGDSIKIKMAPGGGWAAIFSPKPSSSRK